MTPSSHAPDGAARGEGEPTWREVASALMSGAPQVTDYLRLGTLLMPDNSGSEVTSTCIHAVLSLLSLYTDSAEAARGGAFARYKIERRGGAAAEGASETVLETVRRLELLMEMVADRMVGETRKVPLLFAIEFIKTICRIRLTLRGRDLPGRGRRLGLRRNTSLICLMRRELSRSSLRWWMAGSALHALRPLLYLAALHKYGPKSWKPWLLSLLVDMAAEVTASRPMFHARTRASSGFPPQPPVAPQQSQYLPGTQAPDATQLLATSSAQDAVIDVAVAAGRGGAGLGAGVGGNEGVECGEAGGGVGVEREAGGGAVRSRCGGDDGQGVFSAVLRVCLCVCARV